MQIKDHHNEKQLFLGRAITAGGLVILALGLLIGRMVQLQVFEHNHFTTLSKDNRVKLVPLPPTRGLIYDHNGVLLAQNRPAYSLEIIPENVKDIPDTLIRLAQIISITEDDLERFHKLKKRKRRFDSIPIRIDLSMEEAARFAVVHHRFNGVDIKARLLRYYPHPEATAHVIGYVGRISKSDLQNLEVSNYAGSSHTGKTGIERSYEFELHGGVGIRQVEVNSVGRVIRILEHKPPAPGQNLHLHLDIELQKIAMAALGEENGAIAAIDPNSGGILALVSKPSFDPNLFVAGISSKDYQTLQQNPERPLYDRAVSGQYPPGSTIKPFIGLAGLETGQISPETRVFCPGYYQLPGQKHKYRDWKIIGHRHMNLDTSITQSCDVYFYKLAYEIGVDNLSQYLAQFGFGARTGIDLRNEARGILPSREWKRRVKHAPWYPGETVIMGIGQGYYLATPLQLAAATAAIGNGGIYYTPRLLKQFEIRGGDKSEMILPVGKPIQIHQLDNWREIHQSMLNVIEHPRGTAKQIRSDTYRIAGKTGTAQVFTIKQDEEYDEEKIKKKMRDHALFVAYAPANDPRIAIAVIVENGGSGGSTAAPIARKIMDAYLLPERPDTSS